MKIYVFGNPDLAADSLPLKILPRLQKGFPNIHFEIKDPNEEWNIPESKEIIIIDTVLGISYVTLYNNLESFAPSSHVTMHDFDALANLTLLQKLGKIKSIKIIGIPPTISENKALEGISALLM